METKFRLDLTDVKHSGLLKLYRIVALKDFSDIREGDYGGYVATETCLSQYGDCWIYDEAAVEQDAMVMGGATVSDRAIVRGRATIRDNARVCGRSKIFGDITVSGQATVKDCAQVYGFATITDDAVVAHASFLTGNIHIGGSATTARNCRITGNCFINGNAVIEADVKDATLGANAHITSRDDYIFIPSIGPKQLPLAAYRQHGGEPMVRHGIWLLPLSEFERQITYSYDCDDYYNRENIIQDYRTRLNYIRYMLA